MNRIIIVLKIFGSLLIISATFISTIAIIHIEKQISIKDEEIENFHDTRILTTLGILSYESRDVLLGVQDVEYYQMLNYLNALKEGLSDEEKRKEEINKLQKTMQETQQIILDNNIFLARQWATLLSKDRKDEQVTRDITDKIRNDKNLSILQKIEKIRDIQDKNQKVFGDRLSEIHKTWSRNLEERRKLEAHKSLWYVIFVWMQIGGLSALAIAESIEGIIRIKKKHKRVQKINAG